jgi:hypothetical protein
VTLRSSTREAGAAAGSSPQHAAQAFIMFAVAKTATKVAAEPPSRRTLVKAIKVFLLTGLGSFRGREFNARSEQCGCQDQRE